MISLAGSLLPRESVMTDLVGFDRGYLKSLTSIVEAIKEVANQLSVEAAFFALPA